MAKIRAGLRAVKVDGLEYDVIGNVNYNLGSPMREGLVGSDKVHGYKEKPQLPFCELEVRDSIDLDLKALQAIVQSTVTLELLNGKTLVFRNAWFAGEGNGGTEEGNIAVKFEAESAEEIR